MPRWKKISGWLHSSAFPFSLHSHADPEAMYGLNGALEFLQYTEHSSRWLIAQSGEIIRIPGEVKHALRNSSSKPATVLLATTPKYLRIPPRAHAPFVPGRVTDARSYATLADAQRQAQLLGSNPGGKRSYRSEWSLCSRSAGLKA
jgi:uncharacterized protein YaiE (UPF0345 family)